MTVEEWLLPHVDDRQGGIKNRKCLPCPSALFAEPLAYRPSGRAKRWRNFCGIRRASACATRAGLCRLLVERIVKMMRHSPGATRRSRSVPRCDAAQPGASSEGLAAHAALCPARTAVPISPCAPSASAALHRWDAIVSSALNAAQPSPTRAGQCSILGVPFGGRAIGARSSHVARAWPPTSTEAGGETRRPSPRFSQCC